MLNDEESGFFTPTEEIILNYVPIIVSALGIIASILNILVFGLDPSPFRKNAGVFFLITSLSTLGSAVGFFPWPAFFPEYGCTIQALLMHFFWSATLFWTFSITLSLFFTALTDVSLNTLRKSQLWFHAFCWGIPSISTLFCYFEGAFGDGDEVYVFPWCEVQQRFYRLATIAPAATFLLLSPLFWILVKRELALHCNAISQPLARSVTVFINSFIFVYLLITVLPLVNQVMLLVNPRPAYSHFVPFLLECIFEGGQGFWLFLFLGIRQFFQSFACAGEREGEADLVPPPLPISMPKSCPPSSPSLLPPSSDGTPTVHQVQGSPQVTSVQSRSSSTTSLRSSTTPLLGNINGGGDIFVGGYMDAALGGRLETRAGMLEDETYDPESQPPTEESPLLR